MVIGTSIGSAVITYEVIAVLGYLTFGSKVCRVLSPSRGGVLTAVERFYQVGANIIAMYPSTSLFIAVGQLAIVILVLFSYPLQVHPCRNCLDKVFHAGEAVVAAGQEDEDTDHASHDMSPFKHTVLTLAIVGAGFTIAYFVNDLQMGKNFSEVAVSERRLILVQSCHSWGPLVRPPFPSFYLDCSTGR